SIDFFWYRRFAMQISGLLSHPSMGSSLVGKEEKNPAPVTLSRLVSLSNHSVCIRLTAVLFPQDSFFFYANSLFYIEFSID
ncbi:MAG: hypothetical protein II558_06210, partial [Treponema sp.]|nr:hypothetical protein [Treponema sp.]